MDKFFTPVGHSQYALHFSSKGYDVLRGLASRYGNRTTESMVRLIAVSVHRDRRPNFKDGDYSAHDLSVTKLVGLSDFIHARLLSLADANGVPRECLGDLLTDYVVRP